MGIPEPSDCALRMTQTAEGQKSGARTLRLAPTPVESQPPSLPGHAHPSQPPLPLVLHWLDWEARLPVSTGPRLDSDPPTAPAPTPPSSTLWRRHSSKPGPASLAPTRAPSRDTSESGQETRSALDTDLRQPDSGGGDK